MTKNTDTKAREIVRKMDLTVRVNGEWHEVYGIEREKLYERVAVALQSEYERGQKDGYEKTKATYQEIEKMADAAGYKRGIEEAAKVAESGGACQCGCPHEDCPDDCGTRIRTLAKEMK